ncbi:MAG: YlxR family protein [Clostridia bacterium]|nr:YlxR family protein [Clostridia bacterium]
MNDKVHFRMCTGCRSMLHKSALLRICLKEDVIQTDFTGKAGGRGAYVCSEECLRKSVKGKALNKAFRRALSEDEFNKLYEELALWSKTKN